MARRKVKVTTHFLCGDKFGDKAKEVIQNFANDIVRNPSQWSIQRMVDDIGTMHLYVGFGVAELANDLYAMQDVAGISIIMGGSFKIRGSGVWHYWEVTLNMAGQFTILKNGTVWYTGTGVA